MPVLSLGRRPGGAALAGALTIAFSGILYVFSGVSPSTGAFFRCLFALPPLWLMARSEERHFRPPDRRARHLAWLAGAFFAADLLLWHHAIEAVGAGLATVLVNTQVVLVALVAWAVLGERPKPRSLAAIPVVLAGVVLISGLFEAGAYGSNPPLGVLFGVLTAIAYSGFLLVLRQRNEDVRRPAGPLFHATAAAALAILPVGLALGDLDLLPSPAAIGWLVALALSSQVLGWVLISISLPRLPALATSILLTFQPVGSVVFAALLLDESPSPLQLVGVAAILAGLLVASLTRLSRASEPALAE